MRNMSFSLTTNQILDRGKTVTRRLGWPFLRLGDIVMAVEKAQGLKKDELIRRLGPIRITGLHWSHSRESIVPIACVRDSTARRTISWRCSVGTWTAGPRRS